MSGRETSGKRDGLNKLLPVAAVKKNANTRFMLSAILDMDEAVSVKELPGNDLNFTALHTKNTDSAAKRYPCFCHIFGQPEPGFAFHSPVPGQVATWSVSNLSLSEKFDVLKDFLHFSQ